MRNLTLAITVLVGVILSGSVSHSWTRITPACGGKDVKWRNDLDISRNQCSIANSGNVNAAYWNGVNQWNDLTNEVDSFLVRPANDCSIQSGDGVNEVALVNPTTLDGDLGLATLRVGLCIPPFANSIDEADIRVANNLSFLNPTPISLVPQGRGTFVHEFGHLFGFGEENDQMGAMQQTPRPYTGGTQTASVFPTDTLGIDDFYDLSSSRPNLIPSAMNVNTGVLGNIVLLETGLPQACRGSSQSIRFYTGNSGKGNSGTYVNAIRLSTSSSTTTTHGTTVVSTSDSLNSFTEGVRTFNFSVPNSLPYGFYFIHLKMDDSNQKLEVREGDNRTRSGRRLLVNCG